MLRAFWADCKSAGWWLRWAATTPGDAVESRVGRVLWMLVWVWIAMSFQVGVYIYRALSWAKRRW